MYMLAALQPLIAIVVLLGGLVFVHELGHFLVAKYFKVKVLKFSLGFGPRVVGFRWGETEYQISALPLGGYVKMAGEDPTEEIAPADRGRTFSGVKPWKRFLIAFAGPGMNLAFPVLLFFVLYLQPDSVPTTRVGFVEPGLPAWAAGLMPMDKILEVDGQQVSHFGDLSAHISPKAGAQVRLKVERDGQILETTVKPVDVEEKNALETNHRAIIGISPVVRAPFIGISDPGSPAARAGLKTFDRVVSVDSVPVRTIVDLRKLLAQKQAPFEVVSLRDEPLPAGAVTLSAFRKMTARVEPAQRDGAYYTGIEPEDLFVYRVMAGSPAEELGLRRGDRLVSVNGEPLLAWITFDKRCSGTNGEEPPDAVDITYLRDGKLMAARLKQRVLPITDELGQQVELKISGLFHDEERTRPQISLWAEEVQVRRGPLGALRESLRVVPEVIRKTVLAFAGIARGRIAFKNVGGPILLYQLAAKSAEQGWEVFLNTMAMISVNLGVMNLLPVPVLDGFHLVAAAWEAIRRKPMSIQARTVANYVGLALLATLMFFVFKNDIVYRLLNN